MNLNKISVFISTLLFGFLILACNDSTNSNFKKNEARKNLKKILKIETSYNLWNKIYKSENILTTVYHKDSLVQQRNKICNTITSFYNKYGFPNIEEVGETSFNNFCLAATECLSNQDFLSAYLDFITKEHRLKNIESNVFANCIDRITFFKEEKQVYGTLVGIRKRGIKFKPLVPLRDSTIVNNLRANLNLESLEEYIKNKEEKFANQFTTHCYDEPALASNN